MPPELERLAAIVAPLARAELLSRFTRVGAALKPDGSLVTEADLAVQRRLRDALATRWPTIPLLGEEMAPAEQQRLLTQAEGVFWCLDPLDGTSNFAAGILYFAVSLALVEAGAIRFGLVYDPVRDECFTAARGDGVWLNGLPLSPRRFGLPLSRCIAIVDFKRLPGLLAQRLAAQPPFASQRNFDASALDWCMVAAGRGHLYLLGRQNLWDYAAGNLILAEAGGRAATLAGEPLVRLALEPRSAVAALDSDLFAQWNAWLGTVV